MTMRRFPTTLNLSRPFQVAINRRFADAEGSGKLRDRERQRLRGGFCLLSDFPKSGHAFLPMSINHWLVHQRSAFGIPICNNLDRAPQFISTFFGAEAR
jgi:hypothetical protein